ncbi:MAG TPA: PilN domain-containing protein [Rhizomicrobium sp.]|jgi:general secretion pathway protein L
MTVKAILNADISTLMHGLRRLFYWWQGELVAMLPASLRNRLNARPRLIAEFSDGSLTFHEYRRGSAVALPRRGPSDRLLANAFFVLPASAVLVREVSYPRLPITDLRRMIALDMDRLTPFRGEEVIFDLEVQPGNGDGNLERIMIGVVRRAAIEETLGRLWALGGEPQALCLIDRRDGSPRFDFLKAAQVRGRRPLMGMRPVWWWLLVAVLFAANVALLVAKDAYGVASLQEAVAAQRGSVALATGLRRRVELENRKRSAVLDSFKRASPLAVIGAVTKTLPDEVWVQRLEWNGKAVHLIGSASPSQDVSSLLRTSPILRRAGISPANSAKSAKAPVSGTPAGMFDVTVSLKDAP